MPAPSNSSPRRIPPRSWAGLLVGLGAALVAERGSATIIERVVAIVGDQAIFLSEVKARARPLLARVQAQAPSQRAAAVSQIHASVLERMIEDELQQRAANLQQVTVTAQEIDAALERLAQNNKLTVEALMNEAAQAGFSPPEYRQEIRRQLLEAKLVNQRVQGRIRITKPDLEAAYRRLVQEERTTLPFRAAWIRVSVPADPAQARRVEQELKQVAAQAKAGGNFGELARQHSDDRATREQGGVLSATRPGELPPALDRILLTIDEGQVSQAVRVGGAFVILKVLERSRSQLPPFAEAEAELQNRVYVEKVNQARRRWLDNLKRQTHVEVRL